MLAREIKEKFLNFFRERDHVIIPSSPLVPENDPTVLFTTAGMHPLVPFLLGESHPAGKRLANCQACIRTSDIDEVGDSTHLTFFEMLGNWSLGDYFREEAINWSFEFLTSEKWLNIPINKLSVSVFKGDKDVPKDEESAKVWQKLGIPKNKILFLSRKDNWWGPAGKTGPCGPDTEMFYDNGKEKVEIWNNVFMQYNKDGAGKYSLLKEKNVDTGMGLDRVAYILQGKKDVYETELFIPILKAISRFTNVSYKNDPFSYRVIADHIKAAVFIAAEGIAPSNIGQGYVLRKLIRRSVSFARQLGITEPFCAPLVEATKKIYGFDYKYINEKFVVDDICCEEEKFEKTMKRAVIVMDKLLQNKKSKTVSGKDAFVLFTTHGFPLESMEQVVKEKGFKINIKEFEKEIAVHKELSRSSSSVFKGGLADDSTEVKKLHTATHLLHAALKEVLGGSVKQRGSNITVERLRFDFSFERKITEDEISQVEALVNKTIKKHLPVVCNEMELQKALDSGATGLFAHKYGKRVKVFSIGRFSKEVCGGPHIENTSELGEFKIIKEEAVSAGVRRIKAILI